MNQRERVATRSQASFRVARPVPIDESLEDLDSIRQRIESGQAFLRVVEYPWGVGFDVGEVGSQE